MADLVDREIAEARWKWVLQLAGERAKVQWSPQAVAILAPHVAAVLAEEGYVLCKQSDWDLISAQLERP